MKILHTSRYFLIISVVIGTLFQTGCHSKFAGGVEVSRTVPLMGTFVHVKVISHDIGRKDINGQISKVFSLARTLEEKLSVYDAGSELNKLNFSGSMKVSSDILDVLIAAENINTLTSGAFDPTIAPILKRNGFYNGMPRDILDRIPEDDEGVGFHNVLINKETGFVSLENGAWLDVAGIAKGYIVDKMASFLTARGFETFLVNAGGDIYCGKGPSGKKWRIGIREPGKEEINTVLEMEFCAVATSGDYENFIVDGDYNRTMSHIADPSTLMITETAPLGFTVISPVCVTADGLATGMIVMGAKKALETVECIDGVDLIIISRAEGKGSVLMSSGSEIFLSRR